jgi:hypothetical protein
MKVSAADYGKFILRCQQEPWFYVRTVFNAEPSEQQMEALRALADPQCRLSIRSGISTGKTTLGAWATHWHVDCHPHSKCAVTAPSSAQLRDALVAEVKMWGERKKAGLFRDTTVTSEMMYVNDAEDQFAVFKTAKREQPEALQGLHADYILVLVDEAAGVHDAVYDPLRGATGKYATRFALLANPNRATGYFHRTHTQESVRQNWTRLRFNSWNSPHSAKDYLQELLDEYGEESDMYRVRVLGEFPSASPSQLISTDSVNDAMVRHLREDQYKHAPVILGVDVAWEGGDRSCVYLRQGLMSKCLGVWHNIDNMTLADRVAIFEDDYKADAICVDVGWGTGVIDRLRQIGRKPTPVHFGGAPINQGYKNKRAEMWFSIRDWLVQGGALPPREQLKLDLTAPEYGPDDMKKSLERKKDIKKRLGFSPDEGDALALTFAVRVVPKQDRSRAYHGKTNHEYKVI